MAEQLHIDDLLRTAVARDASDIHIKAESPPLFRIYGELFPTDLAPLTPDEAREYLGLSAPRGEAIEESTEASLVRRHARYRGK